eukprot:1575735-Rhodomonas_salina.3
MFYLRVQASKSKHKFSVPFGRCKGCTSARGHSAKWPGVVARLTELSTLDLTPLTPAPPPDRRP